MLPQPLTGFDSDDLTAGPHDAQLSSTVLIRVIFKVEGQLQRETPRQSRVLVPKHGWDWLLPGSWNSQLCLRSCAAQHPSWQIFPTQFGVVTSATSHLLARNSTYSERLRILIAQKQHRDVIILRPLNLLHQDIQNLKSEQRSKDRQLNALFHRNATQFLQLLCK